jgi:hypothetical protein
VNKPQQKVRKIYIAADALWDLRQGTMARISPEFAAAVTAQPGYYTREEDVFNYSDQTLRQDIYKRVFARYKQSILRCSVKTEILQFVHELAKQYIKQAFVTPFLDDFSIEINLYPFHLTDGEKNDLLQIVQSQLGKHLMVSLVVLSPAELTVEHTLNNYASMVMYEWHDWLNTHSADVEKKRLADVGLYVPRIFFDRQKYDEETDKELKKRGKDIFEITHDLLNPFIVVQFLPVALFSASTPVNLPEYRQLMRPS